MQFLWTSLTHGENLNSLVPNHLLQLSFLTGIKTKAAFERHLQKISTAFFFLQMNTVILLGNFPFGNIKRSFFLLLLFPLPPIFPLLTALGYSLQDLLTTFQIRGDVQAVSVLNSEILGGYFPILPFCKAYIQE